MEVLAVLSEPGGYLAQDSSFLYWTGSSSNGVGRVYKIPKAGGSPIVLANGQACPAGIAVDSTSVYFVDFGSFCVYSGAGTVMKMGLDGGSPTVLADKQANPNDVAIDQNHIYSTNFANSFGMRGRGRHLQLFSRARPTSALPRVSSPATARER